MNSCDSQHFHDSDISLLTDYVSTDIQLKRVTNKLKREMPVIFNAAGNPIANPLVAIKKSYSGTLSNLAMRLRLSPSTRITNRNSRLEAEPRALVSEDKDIDELFCH